MQQSLASKPYPGLAALHRHYSIPPWRSLAGGVGAVPELLQLLVLKVVLSLWLSLAEKAKGRAAKAQS